MEEETKNTYSYTCLWIGKPNVESEYIIGTKSTGFHERMYERLFTEHYLRLFGDTIPNREMLINNYHIVFHLMLACPGCQMNYKEIINQDVSISWNKEGCEKTMNSVLEEPKPTVPLSNPSSPKDYWSDSEDEDEKPSHKFRSKKKSVRKSPRKSKKSAPRRKSISKKKSAPRRKSVRKMSPKSKTSRRKSRS